MYYHRHTRMLRPSLSALPRERALHILALGAILLAALVARMWNLAAGVPHAVGIDEPQVVGRALRILATGDWNTHLFDYPPLVIYVYAWVAIACYLWGAMSGAWYSLGTLDIGSVYLWGRTVAALIGVAAVWLTYRLGRELGSRRIALLGAALLAVRPTQVRESHFILTDIPACALTTLTVLLATRAGRVRNVRAYAWAGAAAGLAAAAKYNGAIAFVSVVAAWLLFDRSAADRWRKAGGALAAAGAAFVLAAPYSVLDLPSFLNGLGAQLSRFSSPRAGAEPAWLTYVKHLSLAGRFWVPAAVAGMAVVLWRRDTRRRWIPAVAFALAYFYVLASHPLVFARYALPLSPILALCVAAVALEIVAWSRRWRPLSGPRASRLVLTVVTLLLTAGFVIDIAGWLRQYGRPDTRTLAAAWLTEQAPKGASLAVENSGPTYLDAAGFKVLGTELLIDHPPEWYAGRVQYLVISSADLSGYGGYISAGTVVYEITPAPNRWGPGIVIVRLR